MASRQPRPAATGTTRKPSTKIGKTQPAVSTDELADKLATTLRITSTSKGKAKSATDEGKASKGTDPKEQKRVSMRAVNAASQTLSAVAQKGWKMSSITGPVAKDKQATETKNAAAEASKHIKTLREITQDDIDVERAAMSVLGKLVSLEMFDDARPLLESIHKALCSIHRVSEQSTGLLRLLSIPLPSSPSQDTILLTLTSTYFAHAFSILTNHVFHPPKLSTTAKQTPDIGSFAEALSIAPSHTLVSWVPIFSATLEPKQIDPILSRAYTALTKACAAATSTTSSSTSSSSSAPSVDPKSIFLLRMYAAHCLLHTSAGIIEPSTFWDQVVKFAAVYAKAKPPAPEEDVLKAVLGAFDQLHRSVEEHRALGTERFLSGRGWVEFCEYWMGFAKKAGDIRLVDRIAGLIQVTPSTSSAVSSPQPTEVGKKEVKSSSSGTSAVETSRLFASFTQTTTVLEQNGSDAVQRLQEVAVQLQGSKTLTQFIQVSFDPDLKEDERSRTGLKLDRALERLRRATVTFLESTKVGEQRRAVSQDVLRVIAEVYRPICAETPNADILTRFFDTYFVLAKTALVVTDAHTYVPAHEHLTSAASMIKGIPAEKHVSLNVPNFLRCISGAFHNLGGSLYQAERYGAAVGFLKDACSLGSQALEMRQAGSSTSPSTADEKGKEKESRTEEGWKQLEEQLYRRWELLGVCHSKIGERQEAYHAFVQSVRWFPYVQSGLDSLANRVGAGNLSTFWDSASTVRQLGTLVDRITYLGACELLLSGDAVSLVSTAAGKLEPAMLGVLLERQIDSLETSRHKESATSVIAHLLIDALKVYTPERMPLRRARVLARCLELMYHVGGIGVLDKHLGDVDSMAEEISGLLKNRDLGEDQELAYLRLQYQAMAHLWLALHAHRRPQLDNARIQYISENVESACNILRGAVGSDSKAPKKSATPRKSGLKQIPVPKTSPLVPAPGTRQRASARSSAKKTTTSSSRTRTRTRTAPAPAPAAEPEPALADAAPPVTPARKGRRAPQSEPMNVRTPPRTKAAPEGIDVGVLDLVDIAKLLSLLQLVAQITGLLGLNLLKTRVLDITRRLSEKSDGFQSDACVEASVELARELLVLGKTKQAASLFKKVSNAVQSGDASTEARILFLLRFAECLANQGISDSTAVYIEALELSDDWDVEVKGSTVQRVHARVKNLLYAATACQVFACIQACKDNIPASLSALLRSVRLWTRAADNLSRLAASVNPVAPKEDDENPFEVSKPSTPITGASQTPADVVMSSQAPRSPPRRPAIDPIEWRVTEGLLSATLLLSQAYLTRGSAREAEYFAQRAHDLSASLNAPPMVARTLTKMAEIQLLRGDTEASLRSLEQAATILEGNKGVDLVEVQRLQGLYQEKLAKEENAYEIYETTAKMIEELDELFASSEEAAFRRASMGGSKEVVLPHLLTMTLRHQAWLLRDDTELQSALLEKFRLLAQSIGAEAEQHALLAKLTLNEVQKRFHDDMFLSSLAESAIALPMGMSRSGESASISLQLQDIQTALKMAEEYYWTTLSLTFKQGIITDVREALVSLALVQAFHTSLGKLDQNGSILAASLLDASTTITLRREMVETIDLKFPSSNDDESQWPRIHSDGQPAPQLPKKPSEKSKFLRTVPFDHDELFDDTTSVRKFWETVKERYQAQIADPMSFSTSRTAHLPPNWTIVHITVTEDKNTLFLARQQGGQHQDPLVFRVPLKGRRSESDVDEAEFLTFDNAIQELRDIIHLSDQGTKAAKHVKRDNAEARAAWWKERAALDSRLRALLENIEFCWLGAFKTILSSRRYVTPSILTELRVSLERVFRRSLHAPERRPRSRSAGHKKQASQAQNPNLDQITFDDSLLECLATLSPKCKDEELEDLAYFVLDLYQFHGVPVAIAEIDITQLVVDLRLALEDNNQRMARQAVEPKDDEHVFLVLDRNLQGIPWESMPILKGRSVSRIPSLDFLLDRTEFVKWKQSNRGVGDTQQPGSAIVNPRKGYFILNPSGDLRGTEERFKDWAADMKAAGWDGISGHPPSEQQFLNALRDKDLVVYFGHGGGEQYIRSHKIKTLPTCAATMLWGCSSGMLSEMGDFDRVGTPYHYMLSGCPTLVANLWDVTDRDIDKFSQSVFDKIGLNGRSILDGPSKDPKSVVAAVAQSRDVCKLKYLTGAAPIVCGIPFYL